MVRRRLFPSARLALQIVAAAAIFALLWQVADGPEAARRLAGADPAWLLAALGTLALQTLLSSLRWRLTAAQLGIRINRRTAVREYWLSQLVNQTLPGGILGDAARAVRSRGQAGLAAAAQAVAFERLAGQIGMFCLFAAAFLVTLAAPGGLDWPPWLLAPAAGAVLAGLSAPPALWAALRLTRGRPDRGAVGLGRALARALAAPEVRWRQIGLSLGTTLCNVAAFAFCARAVGADLPLTAAPAIVPLILFAMMIPLSLGGWGPREGAAAALFPLAGATAAEGLAASVAFGLTFLCSVAPALVPTVGLIAARLRRPRASARGQGGNRPPAAEPPGTPLPIRRRTLG